jgi:hypothetical protein
LTRRGRARGQADPGADQQRALPAERAEPEARHHRCQRHGGEAEQLGGAVDPPEEPLRDRGHEVAAEPGVGHRRAQDAEAQHDEHRRQPVDPREDEERQDRQQQAAGGQDPGREPVQQRRGDDRAQQHPGPEGQRHQADRRGADAVLLQGEDHRRERGVEPQVEQGGHAERTAQLGTAPQPGQSLPGLGQHPAPAGVLLVHLGPQVRPDPQRGQRGGQVAGHGRQQRQDDAAGEQGTAGGAGAEGDRGVPPLVRAHRRGQLPGVDDGLQRGVGGRAEQPRAHPEGQVEHQQRPEPEDPGEVGEGQRPDEHATGQATHDHEDPPVVPVGEDPAGDGGHHPPQGPGPGDQAGERRVAGDDEGHQGDGEGVDGGRERAGGVAGQPGQVVAALPEADRGAVLGAECGGHAAQHTLRKYDCAIIVAQSPAGRRLASPV